MSRQGEIEDALDGWTWHQAEEDDTGTWKIPSYRLDLSREVDLIEEVARIIGIERIPSRIARQPCRPSSEADRFYDFQMDVRRALCALGIQRGPDQHARLRSLWSGPMGNRSACGTPSEKTRRFCAPVFFQACWRL